MFLQRIKARQTRSNSAELAGYYPTDYFSAKLRFLTACDRLGLEHHALVVDAPSPTSGALTIDVAVGGEPRPKSALVLSSGVHGVEGFFGSAVQVAFLERLPTGWRPPPGSAVILLHSINPYGFAWQRRFNEENVDLNRNFLMTGQAYCGAPPLCDQFRTTLQGSPWPLGFQRARIAKLALRHGLRSLWETLPVGQYEHPDWLFFGGRDRSQSAQLLAQFMPSLFDDCREIVHLDFHTGLGRWANCELLLDTAADAQWWRNHFGSWVVKQTVGDLRSYEIRGGFGAWLCAQFPHCRYRFATAEFGTYSALRVIQALTHELHWHGQLGHSHPDHWSRQQLREAFAPRDVRWRTSSLNVGLSLIERAADLLWRSDGAQGPE